MLAARCRLRHHPIQSGQEESNLRSHAPKACALPLGYGQPVDRPGFEPGNLLLARELLYQLELAAQGLPDLARRAAATGPAARMHAPWISLSRSLVFRCGIVNTQARSSRRMVLRMDGRNRTRNHWFWRPALSPLSYVHMPGANENRPPGECPASGFRLVLTPLSRSHSGDQGSIARQE
jgi:hypothetical protein